MLNLRVLYDFSATGERVTEEDDVENAGVGAVVKPNLPLCSTKICFWRHGGSVEDGFWKLLLVYWILTLSAQSLPKRYTIPE
jgi:hypothetical protein